MAVDDPGFRFHRDYEEAVRLKDGTKVVLRLIQPSDKQLLLEGFARLSPQSRYTRFLAPKDKLTDDDLRYLTEVDGIDHLAVVAVLRSTFGKEEGIGVGRFVRSRDEADTAEPAITVADDQQGKGLGAILLHRLVEAAWERGIRQFRCELLAENARIRDLLPEVGSDVVIQRAEAGTVVVTFPLEPPAPGKPRQPGRAVRRLLSYFGRELVSLIPRTTRRLRTPDED
jgi:GNAT superfamily N-acetyltransferase